MDDDDLKAAQRALISKLRKRGRKPRTAPERRLSGGGVPFAFSQMLRNAQAPIPEGLACEPPSNRPDARILSDGRYFIDAAADSLAKQRDLDDYGRQCLMRDMFRCAALPDGHKYKLTVRDTRTGLPLPEGVGIGISATLFPRDVNQWLDAQQAGYGWDVELAPTDEHKMPRPDAPHPKPNPIRTQRHRIGRDLLSPLIDSVCARLSDPDDSAAVMAELERIARLSEKDRPAPLVGVDSGGVTWRDGGSVKKLTRRALGDRMRRRRGKPR